MFVLFLFGMFIPYQAISDPAAGVDAERPVGCPLVDRRADPVHTVYGILICSLIFRNYYATAVPTEIIEAARGHTMKVLAINGEDNNNRRWCRRVPDVPARGAAGVDPRSRRGADLAVHQRVERSPVRAVPDDARTTVRSRTPCRPWRVAGNPDYPSIMAGVLVASLPTLIVYIALGKYFVSGR